MPNQKSKPIHRWIGEFMLVFLSVLGAFWVEDYRHNKQEEKDFIEELENIRTLVYNDIKHFTYTYDTSYNGFVKKWWMESLETNINRIKIGNADSLTRFIADYDSSAFGVGLWANNWKRISPSFKNIHNYGKFINENGLLEVITRYQNLYKINEENIQELVKLRTEIHDDLDRLDLQDYQNPQNFKILTQPIIFNRLEKYSDGYNKYIIWHRRSSIICKDLTEKLDSVLIEKGVSSESLPTDLLFSTKSQR